MTTSLELALNRLPASQMAVNRLLEMRAFNRVQFALKDRYIREGALPKYFQIGAWNIGKGTNPVNLREFMWLVASRIQGVWMTDNLLGLLQEVPRNPGILPIIADCIEDAGCNDAELLDTLRMT